MIREAMDKAAEQALRAGQIIRRLRDFVSRGESERRVESLSKLVEEASALALVGRQGARRPGALPARPGRRSGPGRQGADPAGHAQFDAQRHRGDGGRSSAGNSSISTEPPTTEWSKSASPIPAPASLRGCHASAVSAVRHDQAQGMGVGLSISRTIIEAHGGQIWVEPNAGRGRDLPVHVAGRDGRGERAMPD